MIIKIKSHKRQVFKQILEYMLNDKDRLFDENKNSFAITHNLKGKTVAEWENQYKANEQFRKCKRSDSVYLTHEILSWHRDDAKNITHPKMEEMAREYIRQRNPKGIYVAVPHFDKQHYHIHICASGIEFKTGKSLRLAKTNLQNLKKNIQQFQIERFPELSKSVVQHGKKDKSVLTDKEYQIKLRTGRETDKEQLIGMLKTCYKKADSKETFLQMLRECKIIPYKRGGRTSGIVFKNKKFRLKGLGFTSERLEELEHPMKRKNELNKVRQNIKDKNIERNKCLSNPN